MGFNSAFKGLIIGSKYCKIWKMKIIMTIILMKNGKTLKQ